MAAKGRTCPGQNPQFWKPEDIQESPCKNCGYMIEFFKDDVSRLCPECGVEMVNPNADFACAEWCAQAEQCLGPELYSQLMEKHEREKRKERDFRALMNSIPEGEKDVRRLFTELYRENDQPGMLIDVRRLHALEKKNPALAKKAMSWYRRFTEDYQA